MEYQTAIIVSPGRPQAADRSPRNQISIGRSSVAARLNKVRKSTLSAETNSTLN
jgi:hypothetical protein